MTRARKTRPTKRRDRSGNQRGVPPKLEELQRIEERVLSTQLEAVRATIVGRKHPGEKGAALEHDAETFFRRLLPSEYGLGRGFVVWIEGEEVEQHGRVLVQPNQLRISDQCDLIIYDALRGSPLVQVGSSQVFAIEHVLGVVEVKTTAESELRKTARLSRQLRDPDFRWFSVPGPSPIQATRVALRCSELTATRVRFFLFAYSAKSDNAQTVRSGIGRAFEAARGYAHLDGALVVDRGCFATRPNTSEIIHQPRGVAAFKSRVITALGRSFRPPVGWTADIDRYLVREAQADPANPYVPVAIESRPGGRV